MRAQLPLLLLTWAVLLTTACSEKYDLDKADFLEVAITGVDSLSIDSLFITATITNHEVDPIDDYGLIWSRSDTLPTLFFNEGKKSRGKLELADAHTFSEILELDPATSYRIIAYATIGEKIFYSPSVSNVTGTAKIFTDDFAYTEGDTIHLKGRLEDLKGGLKAIERGFCWSSINPEPVLRDTFVNLGTTYSDGPFETTISGLINDTAYHFRAYAILSKGLELDTIFGKTKFFDGDLKNAWTRKAPFPGGPRIHAVSFVIDDQAYVGGGKDPSGTIRYDFYRYDPWTDSWAAIDSFPGEIGTSPYYAISALSGFSIGGKGYVGYPSSLFSYSPQEGWNPVEIHDFYSCYTGPLSSGGITEIQSIVIEDKACFIESFLTGDGVLYGFMNVFDPQTDSVTCLCSNSFSVPTDFVSFSIGSNGYLGLGKTGEFGGDPFQQIQKFNTSTACAFSGVPDLPIILNIRYGGLGLSIGDRAYLGFGKDINNIIKSDLWEYQSGSDLWTAKNGFPGTPRAKPVGFSCRGRAYVGLGSASGNPLQYLADLADFYEYDPD
ncbi:MAG: hypothetical protein H6563_13585 [Lewinellaceae bacterium]|nr:hypothetical protein [Lewinellaceae bacterium]